MISDRANTQTAKEVRGATHNRMAVELRYLEEQYGHKFPAKARYIRKDNRIYFSTDFEHDEQIEFVFMCSTPSSSAQGYAFYRSIENPWKARLIHIEDLKGV